MTEFLIIGQGLAGTLLAFELFNKGLDFKIVASAEKSRASSVAAGMINPLVFKRLTKSWMVDELLPVMSYTFSELEQLLNEKFFFHKTIIKPLSEQEKQLWETKQSEGNLSDYILSVQDKKPFASIIDAAGYGCVNQSGYVDLSTFLNAAKFFFKKRGLLIEETIDFNDFEITGNSANHNNLKASKIIFCEGSHIIHNPFFSFIKMVPTKGELLLIYSEKLPEAGILNKQVFVLPIGNHRFKVGSTYDWNDLSEKTTKEGENSIINRLDNLISEKYTLENHWAGIRPTVSDRRPILGFHPEYKNLAVFNGLGTKGVMLGPYFAKEMVKVITKKEDNFLPSEIHVKRFF